MCEQFPWLVSVKDKLEAPLSKTVDAARPRLRLSVSKLNTINSSEKYPSALPLMQNERLEADEPTEIQHLNHI